jgi:predicted alpha/beta superfamily hydrolase
VWWDNREILQTVQALEEATGQRILLYVGTGESKSTVENVRILKEALIDKGWPERQIEYIEAPNAGHNERAWAEQAKSMLLFLYQSE